MGCNFKNTGTLKKPGPIGRWARIGNGIGVLGIVFWITVNNEIFLSTISPDLLQSILILLGVIFALLNFIALITIGIGRETNWPLLVAVLMFIVMGFPIVSDKTGDASSLSSTNSNE